MWWDYKVHSIVDAKRLSTKQRPLIHTYIHIYNPRASKAQRHLPFLRLPRPQNRLSCLPLKTKISSHLLAAGLQVQQAVATTNTLAGIGNSQATQRTTTSLIRMISCAPIAWSVYHFHASYHANCRISAHPAGAEDNWPATSMYGRLRRIMVLHPFVWRAWERWRLCLGAGGCMTLDGGNKVWNVLHYLSLRQV